MDQDPTPGPRLVLSGLGRQSGYRGKEKGGGVHCSLKPTPSLCTLGDMVSHLPSNLIGEGLLEPVCRDLR